MYTYPSFTFRYNDAQSPNLAVSCGSINKIESKNIKNVKKIVIHPRFIQESTGLSDKNKASNVGLLFLEEDYELNADRNVICLPSMKSYNDFLPETCIATGYGERPEFEGLNDFDDKMKALPIPVITNSECESWILKGLGINFKVHESQLCAGVEGSFESDTCNGDGGSPLVCNKKSDPNTFVQVGLVSARLSDAKCGTSSIPGIYSNIAESICMIKSIVQHEVRSLNA